MSRLVALALALAACGSKPEPTCRDAINNVAAKLAGGDATKPGGDATKPGGEATKPERDDQDLSLLIGTCEQHAWTPAIRTCLSGAATGDAAIACMPVPPPIPLPEAKPSAETLALAKKLTDGKAIGFFQKNQPASERVAAYFKALGIPFEVLDRFVAAEMSAKYRVTVDGTIVIARGDANRQVRVRADDRAAWDIERLDANVGVELKALTREKRYAYVAAPTTTDVKFTVLERQLRDLSFEKRDLDATALAAGVPADATVAIVIGTHTAAEWTALAAYLDRGGHALVAIAPPIDAATEPIERVLGLRLLKGTVNDDKAFLPQRGNTADHQFAATSEFSAHPTTTALSRSSGKGMLLWASGAFENTLAQSKRTIAIRSMGSSWLDLDADYTFDDGAETRAKLPVAVAIEGETKPWRAFAIADGHMFADVLVRDARGVTSTMTSGPLFMDVMRWLAGEELFSGEVVVEPPVPPKHVPTPAERDAEMVKTFVYAR